MAMLRRPASRCRLRLHLRPVAARRARRDKLQQRQPQHRLNRRTTPRTYPGLGQLQSPPRLHPSIPMLSRQPCLQEQPMRATLQQAQPPSQSIPRSLSKHPLLLLLLPPPKHPSPLHQIRASPLRPRSSRSTSTRQRSLRRPRSAQEPARQLANGPSRPLIGSGGIWAELPWVSLLSELELWPGRWEGTGTLRRRS